MDAGKPIEDKHRTTVVDFSLWSLSLSISVASFGAPLYKDRQNDDDQRLNHFIHSFISFNHFPNSKSSITISVPKIFTQISKIQHTPFLFSIIFLVFKILKYTKTKKPLFFQFCFEDFSSIGAQICTDIHGALSFRPTGDVLVAREFNERRRERSQAGGVGALSVRKQTWLLLLPHGTRFSIFYF